MSKEYNQMMHKIASMSQVNYLREHKILTKKHRDELRNIKNRADAYERGGSNE